MGRKINTQEYKEYIADIKSGKIILFLEPNGSINHGNVSKLNAGVKPQLPEGSIIIRPE
jgi:hypothetical protein